MNTGPLALAAPATAAARERLNPERPSIVLILADDRVEPPKRSFAYGCGWDHDVRDLSQRSCAP
jgi:hypothetical protein